MLLFGLVLVGPVAFAWGLFEGLGATGSGGGEDQSSVEDGANLVGVPNLYRSATAQSDLAAVGLELGRQDEAPSDEVPVGAVSEQDPAEGTEVEEGTAVDVVVSAGPPPRQAAPPEDDKESEKRRQEAEKEREKQQQEAEKEREKKQQEEEKRKEKGE